MTKQILLFSATLMGFLFFSLSLSAQKLQLDQVPDEVEQSLEFEHPAAKVSIWVLEEGEYIATFKEDGSTGKAYFKPEGDWIKTTYSVPKNQLPPMLRDYVENNYPGFTYAVILLRQMPGEKLHYYIEVRPEDLAEKNSILTFNENGEIMKRIDPRGFKAPEREGTKKSPLINTGEKPEVSVYVQEKGKKDIEIIEEEQKFDDKGNQLVSENQVPDFIKKELAKKAQRPENLEWYINDTFFVAKCLYREQNNEIFITHSGKWEKTYTELPETSVTGNVLKHLNSFYNGWRFKTAVRETRADKNDKTLVDIYEKQNWKQKLVTSVLFDKTGKLIRSFDPNYNLNEKGDKEEKSSTSVTDDKGLEKYYQKMSMEGVESKSIGIPDVVVNAFKAKYPKIPNPQWSEDGDTYCATYMGARGKEIVVIGAGGTLLQIQTEGNPEVVSDAIENYIKKNHKGFKVTEIYSVRDLLEKRNLYKVIVSNKKTSESIELWFTTSGTIVE